MRIKLDENLPSRLAFLLGRFGHDVDTVHSEGLSGCRDDALWEECQKKQRFLITQDSEFTALNSFHRPVQSIINEDSIAAYPAKKRIKSSP